VFTGIGASTTPNSSPDGCLLQPRPPLKWASVYQGNSYVYTNFGIRAGGVIGFAPSTDPAAAADTVISRDSANVIDFGNAQGDQSATIVFGTAQAKRLTARKGSVVVAGDFALSAGWGASAAAVMLNSTSRDQGGQVSIQANGTTTANPTVTLTFHDGTWGNAPAVQAVRGDTHTPTTAYWAVSTVTATTVQFIFVGTPTTGTNYTLNWSAMGT
jgi:hypothetical protein